MQFMMRANAVTSFDDNMRLSYVRILLPRDSHITNVRYFKLVINPSYTEDSVVLLNLETMGVSVMPMFKSQGLMIKLSLNP